MLIAHEESEVAFADAERVMDESSQERLLLRVMIEAENEADVSAVMPEIEAALSPLSTLAAVASWSCERYWKFPDLFDTTLVLTPVALATPTFMEIVAQPGGWELEGCEDEYLCWDAVWSRNVYPDQVFLHPKIEWAQLILNERKPHA
jgi:hypothetical protein